MNKDPMTNLAKSASAVSRMHTAAKAKREVEQWPNDTYIAIDIKYTASSSAVRVDNVIVSRVMLLEFLHNHIVADYAYGEKLLRKLNESGFSMEIKS